MTVTTQLLVGNTVTALLAQDGQGSYPTSAGARIYEPRDWPTWDNLYPAIFVSAPTEHKTSLGRAQHQFTVISTIRVVVRASAPGAADDGNAGVVQAHLWEIQRQVETVLINAPHDLLPIQQFVSVDTQMSFNATGEKHLGELMIDLEMEFFQGSADFALVPAVELQLLTAGFSTLPPAGVEIEIPQDP